MANNNNLDGFERQLKEHLEHYEVPFNSADWAQMDRALSSGVRAWGHGRALVAGLLLADLPQVDDLAHGRPRNPGNDRAGAHPF